METIITPFYWGLIHGPSEVHDWTFYKGILDHSTPFFFLIVQFLMSNHPFAYRHSVLFIFLGLGYLVMDYINARRRGYSTYGAIPWDGSTTAFVTPILTGVFGLLFFFMWGYFAAIR
eukprot:CAMPEP_0170496896 /NCGR_PEP_ID=MMETSP0208-20121228/23026_1 /TAXON_ID=197538 /ORGANISM="Strombidium inclinatum, Strain S3" /LENGTH=116 /DNA_ID=CAMNT_0010773541 /DNA_START=436 /DNA_END=786 /DNA_ORIENTATION=+